MPPSVKELELRLLRRGTDDRQKISMRVAKAEQEMKLANQFDNIIINENLEQAKKEVYNIVYSFIKT